MGKVTQQNTNEVYRDGKLVSSETVEVDVTTEVVEWDLTAKLRARLDAAKADIAEIVGDGTTVGTIDQANADIAAAQAAIAAAQVIIDGTGTNAQKNAARQDKRDAQQDLAIARLTKRSEQRDLNALRALNSVTRLLLRADLLDSNEGT